MDRARVGNDATFNVHATDAGDWSVDTTTALTVDINNHLALRSSLQWPCNNRPALQEGDVVVIGSGGIDIDIGDVRHPRGGLDTVFTNSIIISL